MSETPSRVTDMLKHFSSEIKYYTTIANDPGRTVTSFLTNLLSKTFDEDEPDYRVNRREYKQKGIDGMYKYLELSAYLPTRNIPAWYTGEPEPTTHCLNFNEDAWPAALAKAVGSEREAVAFLELLLKTMFPKLTTFCPTTFASIFSKTHFGKEYCMRRYATTPYDSCNKGARHHENKITRGVFDEYDINAMYPYLMLSANASDCCADLAATYKMRQRIKPELKPYVKLAMNAYASSKSHYFSANQRGKLMTLFLNENEPENVGIYMDSILLPIGSKPKSIPVSDEIGHFKFVRQTPEITVFALDTGDLPRRRVLKGAYFCTKISTTQFIVCGHNEAGNTSTFIYTKNNSKEPDLEDYHPEQTDILDRIVINTYVTDFGLGSSTSPQPAYNLTFVNRITVMLSNIRFLIDQKYSFNTLANLVKAANQSPAAMRAVNALQMIDSYAHMNTK